MPTAIVVKQRSTDWQVHLYGDTAIWDCGNTMEAAIRSFLLGAEEKGLPTERSEYVIFNG